MDCTVASMLTTTPRLRPCVGATPSPASRSSPPGSISATTAITLAVPMSSPTTRSLYSLAIAVRFLLLARGLLRLLRVSVHRQPLQLDCIAFRMAEVGVLQRRVELAQHLRHGADEARRALHDLVLRAAAEFDGGPVVEIHLPAAAARQAQRRRLGVHAGEQRLQA